MAENGSLTIEQLKQLCDQEGDNYVSKKEDHYIDALSRVFSLDNKNDKPFTKDDILCQLTLDTFNFEGKNDFSYVCKLKANPMTFLNEALPK